MIPIRSHEEMVIKQPSINFLDLCMDDYKLYQILPLFGLQAIS